MQRRWRVRYVCTLARWRSALRCAGWSRGIEGGAAPASRGRAARAHARASRRHMARIGRRLGRHGARATALARSLARSLARAACPSPGGGCSLHPACDTRQCRLKTRLAACWHRARAVARTHLSKRLTAACTSRRLTSTPKFSPLGRRRRLRRPVPAAAAAGCCSRACWVSPRAVAPAPAAAAGAAPAAIPPGLSLPRRRGRRGRCGGCEAKGRRRACWCVLPTAPSDDRGAANGRARAPSASAASAQRITARSSRGRSPRTSAASAGRRLVFFFFFFFFFF